MTERYFRLKAPCLLSILCLAAHADPFTAFPGVSDFDGTLLVGGQPVSGKVEIQTQLFDSATGGKAIVDKPITSTADLVEGNFSAPIDIFSLAGGDSVSIRDCFHGSQNGFLQISVRRPGETDFTPLSPRQPVGSLPLSLMAGTAVNADHAFIADNVAVGALRPAALLTTGQSAPSNGQVLAYREGNFSWVDASTIGVSGSGADGSVVWNLNGKTVLRILPEGPADYPKGSPSLIAGAAENHTYPGTGGSVITGGGLYNSWNEIGGDQSFIGSGFGNKIGTDLYGAALVGGWNNYIGNRCTGSFIGAGNYSVIGDDCANGFIGAGVSSRIGGNSQDCVIVGGYNTRIGTNSSLSVIGGGEENRIGDGSDHSAVLGGYINRIADQSSEAFIGGGQYNVIGGHTGSPGSLSSIVGGYANHIESSSASTIVGGENNAIPWSSRSVIGGGIANLIATNTTSVIAGGNNNQILNDSQSAVIGGGAFNSIDTNAVWSTIPGGRYNKVGGQVQGGFAAGVFASALHTGSFVWGDGTEPVESTSERQVTFKATGGARFLTSRPGSDPVVGAELSPGSGSWSTMSDRNSKANLSPVDARAVLDKVAHLPLATWNYKSQAESVRHIGPMAQDFRESFGLGEDDRHISSVDADGIALAAIQGLNQVVEQQQAELRRKEADLRSLQDQVSELKALVSQLAKQK